MKLSEYAQKHDVTYGLRRSKRKTEKIIQELSS